MLVNSQNKCLELGEDVEAKSMADKNSSGTFITGIAFGGLIGTAIGLLIAPRTGRETRQLLKKSADALPELAEDLATSVQLQTDRWSESTIQNWEETLIRLKEAIAAGREAKEMIAQENAESNAIHSETPISDKHF